MARPKSIEIANRDLRIQKLAEQGYRYRDISKIEGISVSRISQIIHATDQEITDDEQRSKLRITLESYLYDTIEPLRHGPGKVMTASGTGKVITYPEGHPQAGEIVYDPSFKLEITRAGATIIRDLAKLGAIEKQKPLIIEEKQVDTTQLDTIVANYEGILQRLRDSEAELELFKAGGIEDADVVEDPAIDVSPGSVTKNDDGIPS